jgi:TetR/AcrR family transcriptional repressor of nem operon
MLVFWRRGYEDCSVADLVKATELKRQGLYNTFGDKHGLFLAALQKYRELVEGSLIPLRHPDADMSDIRRFMEDTLKLQEDGDFGGCLMVRTALGPGHHDELIRSAVDAGASSVRACFAQVIKQSKARKEISASIEPEALAGLLFTVLHGLAALVRTGGSAREVSSVLSQTLGPDQAS